MIVATHAHYDHAQGIPNLRRAASKKGREVEVYASWFGSSWG